MYDKAWQRRQRMSPLHGELILEVDPGWSIGLGEQTGPAGRHGAPTELYPASCWPVPLT